VMLYLCTVGCEKPVDCRVVRVLVQVVPFLPGPVGSSAPSIYIRFSAALVALEDSTVSPGNHLKEVPDLTDA
jgi:hypothetical protein